MSNANSSPTKIGIRPTWIIAGVVCVVAVGGGLLVPKWAPASKPAPNRNQNGTNDKRIAKEDNKDKNKNPLLYKPPQWSQPPDAQGMLFRLVLGTVIVLVLCVGTLWLGKRFLGTATPAASENRRLEVEETLALGNRCWVHLLTVGGQQMLIGQDATGIKSISPLPNLFENTLLEVESGLPAPPQPVDAKNRSSQRSES